MSECLREEILGRVPVLKNSRHAREGGNPDLVGDRRTGGVRKGGFLFDDSGYMNE